MKNYFLALFLFCFSVFASGNRNSSVLPDNYKFRRLSPEGGLGDNGLRDARQDPWGFVWIITVNDLFRFDGYTYKRYTHKLPKYQNNNDWNLKQLEVDADGILYVASMGGLLKYNPLSDGFDRVYNQQIQLVFKDSKQRMWICGHSIGLFDPEKQTFTSVKYENESIRFVSSIYEEKEHIYIGTENGQVYQLDEKNMNFEPVFMDINDKIVGITCFDSTLYVLSEHRGLHEISLKENNITDHYTFFYPSGDTRISVRHLYKDKSDMLWICTQYGVYIMDPIQKKHTFHTYDKSDPYGLPSRSIWKITEGNQNNLWLGTYSGGLAFFSFSEGNVFQSYNSKTDLLSFPVVSSFIEQGPYLWVGTEGGGLNRYNTETGEFKTYYTNTSKNSLSFNNINALQLIEDELWISLPRSGIDRFNVKTEVFTNLSTSTPGASFINSHTGKIITDGKNGIWIIYLEGDESLSYYSIDNHSCEHFYLYEDPYFLEGNVSDICMGYGDTLWIATTGLLKMNTQTKQIIFPDTENKTSWNSFNIQTINHNKSTGDVWIGTNGQGLIRYSVTTKEYVQEVELSKFGVHTIFSIQFDAYDHVWFSTDNGLFRFTPTDSQLLQFNKSDGTQGQMYCRHAGYQSPSGKLYFGGNEGFTIVDPLQVSRNKYAPQVIISELLINNEPAIPTQPQSPLSLPIYLTEKIKLLHDQNNFSFEFASTNYLNPEKNRFRYRLNGYDKDWIETDALHRIASYSKVPAGKYTFAIITANNDGVWGKEHTIQVTVLPAPWVSLWAIIGYAILFISLTVSLLRYYHERRSLKLQLYLEEKEHEQKEEYHQEQLRFFTNVSHDFRTPLSLIMVAFDSIKTEISKTKYRDIIENNVRRLHRLVNELLDFRSLQNGKMSLSPTRKSWNNTIETYCSDFYEYAHQKNIHFSTHFDETLPTELFFDSKVLEKIVLNLLNNAFKYTAPGGKITVHTYSDISLFESAHTNKFIVESHVSIQKMLARPDIHPVTLVVSDTGIGISENSLSKVFERYYQINDVTDEKHIGSGIGLALVKSLVELHGGNITIYSERNKGTDIVVTLYLSDSQTHKNLSESIPSKKQLSDSILNLPAPYVLAEENVTSESKESVETELPVFFSKVKLLLVEDNEELRELVAGMLSENYEVIEAENGAEALKLLEDENPELIVTDVMMPVINGITLCKTVKENIETSHIPVVMLTAKSGMENHIEGIEVGADLYLEKPINKKLLMLSLSNLLKQQERIKEFYSKNFFTDQKEVKIGKRDKEFMEILQNEIEKQIMNPELDVNHLASSLAISRSKLYSKIKVLTGKSVVEFIRSYRLHKIAKMLLEEDQPINIIIEKAGIDNPSYFSRIFKKEFGVTPSEFIENQRKKQ